VEQGLFPAQPCPLAAEKFTAVNTATRILRGKTVSDIAKKALT
jgi:hypothetical protein